MSYIKAKEELKKVHKNIKYFTKECYNIIMQDRATAAALFERGENVQEFYKNSATTKTDFYQKNGGAYCELLCILGAIV